MNATESEAQRLHRFKLAVRMRLLDLDEAREELDECLRKYDSKIAEMARALSGETSAANTQPDRTRREPDWGLVPELWRFLVEFHSDLLVAHMSSDERQWLTDLLHEVMGTEE